MYNVQNRDRERNYKGKENIYDKIIEKDRGIQRKKRQEAYRDNNRAIEERRIVVKKSIDRKIEHYKMSACMSYNNSKCLFKGPNLFYSYL